MLSRGGRSETLIPNIIYNFTYFTDFDIQKSTTDTTKLLATDLINCKPEKCIS
jgi:hypothetical protein